ncbi:MAG: sigma-70 family RNA polymerase sigma factor [Planctomycetota bacterium]
MTIRDDSSNPGAEPDRDHQTVALFRAGDPEGLRHLLEDYGGLVRSRLRHSFGKMLDDSELDEVMSLASIRAWHAAPRFDEVRGTLRAWLSVIARNCALRLLDMRRRNQMELPGDLDQLIPQRIGVDVATADRRRLTVDVTRCINRLPTLQRAVLRADLDAGDTVPAEQLARRLGTTANSIYVSRLKGRRALRLALQSLGHFARDDAQEPDMRQLDAGAEQA